MSPLSQSLEVLCCRRGRKDVVKLPLSFHPRKRQQYNSPGPRGGAVTSGKQLLREGNGCGQVFSSNVLPQAVRLPSGPCRKPERSCGKTNPYRGQLKRYECAGTCAARAALPARPAGSPTAACSPLMCRAPLGLSVY